MTKHIMDIKLIISDFIFNYELKNLYNDENMINDLIDEILIIYYEINTKKIDREIIYKLILEKQIVKDPIYNQLDIDTIKQQIVLLKKIKQPEQRSKEWHIFRNNRLTASDLATSINLNPYGDRKKLIAKKCGYKEEFKAGAAIIHGVKYEPVATYFYEKLNNISIYEYGCVPHPNCSYFAASPDGICDYDSRNPNYVGRMLEIKCPKSRELNGFVPEYYELQVQGQLEVCDLDYCDYLECVIKEYDNVNSYLSESKEYFKGIVLELYNNKLKKMEYIYNYDDKNLKDIDNWEEKNIETILADDNYEYIATTYWYIEQYDIILVKRDKERFAKIKQEIDIFWNEVLKYRDEGYQSLLKLPKEKKKYEVKQLDFLPD